MKTVNRTYKCFFASCMSVVMLLVCITETQALASNGNAIVTKLSGDASMYEGGDEIQVTPMDVLWTDSLITVTENSSITIVFTSEGKEYIIHGPARFTIKQQQPDIEYSRFHLVKRLYRENKQVQISQAVHFASTPMRGNDGNNHLVLVSPSSTLIMSQSPAFKWNPVEDAIRYTFVLYDEMGNTVYESSTTGTSMALPSNILLSRGSAYTWEISTIINARKLSESTDFIVATEEDITSYKNNIPHYGSNESRKAISALVANHLGFRQISDEILSEADMVVKHTIHH